MWHRPSYVWRLANGLFDICGVSFTISEVHKYNPARHVPEVHGTLTMAAHLPIDEIEERVRSHLSTGRSLTLQSPEQGVGEQAVPKGRALESRLVLGTCRHDDLTLPPDNLQGSADHCLVVGLQIPRERMPPEWQKSSQRNARLLAVLSNSDLISARGTPVAGIRPAFVSWAM